MKKAFFFILFITTGSPAISQVKHLRPFDEFAHSPPELCKIIGILPDSPAQKSGLQIGDTLLSVDGKRPLDALALADLINHSSDHIELQVRRGSGEEQKLAIVLNRVKPRLGASCDLEGWTQQSVSRTGDETLTVYKGPYMLTVSGTVDKGLLFLRAHLSNHSSQPLEISPEVFSAADGEHSAMTRLSPEEVLYFLHGKDAVSYLKAPQGKELSVSDTSVVLKTSNSQKSKKEWSHDDEEYIKANADYLSKQSLWPTRLKPGEEVEGLIYFLDTSTPPYTIGAQIDNAVLKVSLEDSKPSSQHMTPDELTHFLSELKKGDAVRLTLKNGKVFSGKYASYDELNETVWLNRPSGALLTTSSFGLRAISYAEVLTPNRPTH